MKLSAVWGPAGLSPSGSSGKWAALGDLLSESRKKGKTRNSKGEKLGKLYLGQALKVIKSY